MDLYEDPDPQTNAAYLKLLGVKSTDTKIRSHDDKLTVSRNRSTLSRSGRSVRGSSLSPVLGSGAVATATTQARGDSIHQLRRSANMIKTHSPRSRPVEQDVSLQIGDGEPLSDAALPRQGRSRSHSMKSDTSRTTEVDHILSLFGGKKGSKQLLQLESDEAQYYADILDEVRYSIKLHSAPADLTLRPVSKQDNTAQSNTGKAAEMFAEDLRNIWHPPIIVHPYGHI